MNGWQSVVFFLAYRFFSSFSTTLFTFGSLSSFFFSYIYSASPIIENNYGIRVILKNKTKNQKFKRQRQNRGWHDSYWFISFHFNANYKAKSSYLIN